MKRFVGLALASVLLFGTTSTYAESPPVATGVFFPETFTLKNGLQVVVITNRRVPVVTQMVWYKVGAADEVRFKSGEAHFLEHLMFKATDKLKAGDFSKIVAKNGGQDNAFTSWDYTAFYQTVSADRLGLVMGMEADRMQNLHLTDATVTPERSVIIEERHQRTDREPADRLEEQAQATMFVHHPYGTPVIGWLHEMEGLTRQDEEKFYKTWYAPNNAVLVIAGDADAAQVRPLAEKYFGSIPARAVPERVRVEEPPLTATRRVTLRDPEVRQPEWSRRTLAPSYHRGATQYAYALQILSEILGGGATSRLHRALVLDKKIATAAGSGYSPDAYDLSTFGLYVAPLPGADMDKVEQAVDEVTAALLKDGVTAQEVEDAKVRLRRSAILERDSLSGPAEVIGQALAVGRTVDDVEAWPARIAAVTVEQVNEAAKAVLLGKDVVISELLPSGALSADDAAETAPAELPGLHSGTIR